MEIDLTKNQIIDPMIEAWVWFTDKRDAVRANLVSIDHRSTEYPYRIRTNEGFNTYSNCSLTNPNEPKVKKWKL